jgi:NAD(P)H dehydrogenase (quinone)
MLPHDLHDERNHGADLRGHSPLSTIHDVYLNFLRSGEVAIPTVAAVDVGAFAARALLDPAPKQREVADIVGPAYSPTQIAAALGEAVGRSVSVLDVPAAGQRVHLERWMSPEAARALIETFDCLGSERLGSGASGSDRIEHGTTRLEQVLRGAPAGGETDFRTSEAQS